jgi:hypothetical protein
MNPVTLLLAPPSFFAAPAGASSSPFRQPNQGLRQSGVATTHQAVQAQAYLAQSIAQEYLPAGLTIEPHAQAAAAYRRRVPPPSLVNVTA